MGYLSVIVIFLLFDLSFQTIANNEVCIADTTGDECNCLSSPPPLPQKLNTRQDCNAPRNTNSSGSYNHGSQETFWCEEGYALDGGGEDSVVSSCDNGEWNPPVNCVWNSSTELPTDGITLTCTATQMFVDIPKDLLTGGMTGDDVRLEGDAACLGEDTNNNGVDIIRVTTSLTGCGTNMTETSDHEIYTNRVIENIHGIVTRMYELDIPFSCSYNRSQRVGPKAYVLTDYSISKSLADEGAFAFSFEIYTDASYSDQVTSYPYRIGLNEDLHFAAEVLSQGETIDLSIQLCRATPNSLYENHVYYDFIEGGCSSDGENTIITNITNSRIGVTTKSFRFVEGNDLVYIHCDLLVCDADDTNSICNMDCASRKRRDVSDALVTKRFTRGPFMRETRAAEKIVTRTEHVQKEPVKWNTHGLFSPWMVAMVTTGVMITALAVVLVKSVQYINKIDRGQIKQKK